MLIWSKKMDIYVDKYPIKYTCLCLECENEVFVIKVFNVCWNVCGTCGHNQITFKLEKTSENNYEFSYNVKGAHYDYSYVVWQGYLRHLIPFIKEKARKLDWDDYIKHWWDVRQIPENNAFRNTIYRLCQLESDHFLLLKCLAKSSVFVPRDLLDDFQIFLNKILKIT